MSKLDKDTVLAEFTAAYEQAHGKQPKIESSSGWYSVDGGKNVRLAQLEEETAALKAKAGGGKAPAAASKAKAAKPAAKTPTKAAKATTKAAAKPAVKTAAKKAPSKNANGGLSAKQLWAERLQNAGSKSRLPRGM